MSAKFYTLLTEIGAAKLASSAALGVPLKITQMAVGDGGGVLPTPSAQQTRLVAEKRRSDLNMLYIDPQNSSQIIAEQVIPETEGGWWIREVGLFDDTGALIAVGNCPESYKPQLAEGSGRTQTVRMVLITSSTENVTLKIDPAVVLATRKYVDDRVLELKVYVDDQLAKHIAAADPHSQYAPKDSPTLTGTPKTPTAPAGTNTTQIASTAFVKAALAALVGSSPAALDTLNELAAALGNDPNFAEKISNSLAGKMDKAKNGSDIPSVAAFIQNLGLISNGSVGRLVDVKVIKTSGTYIPTPGTKKIIVECVGGGGGGGGSTATTAGNSSIGAGGSEGCYGKSIFSSLVNSYLITIGAGGAGFPGAPGGVGGSSSFGSLISADGGLGGGVISSGASANLAGVDSGAVAPTVTGANISSSGHAGTFIFAIRLNATYSGGGVAGMGGRSIFGDGGGSRTSAGPGVDAISFGAGGGGAKSWINASADSPYAGGKGASGAIIIWEYA